MKAFFIERFIPEGRENAVTRQQLCIATGLPDRTVRECIEQARRRGVIIINKQDGAGYYRTDDPAEIKRQYRQNDRRAKSILAQQKHLRRRPKASGIEPADIAGKEATPHEPERQPHRA